MLLGRSRAESDHLVLVILNLGYDQTLLEVLVERPDGIDERSLGLLVILALGLGVLGNRNHLGLLDDLLLGLRLRLLRLLLSHHQRPPNRGCLAATQR